MVDGLNRGLPSAAPPQPKVLTAAFLFSVMATDKHRFSAVAATDRVTFSSALLFPQLSTINFSEATSTSGIFVSGG
jgi:hypothetical protein